MEPVLHAKDGDAGSGEEPDPASILAGAQPADVAADPFCHLVAPGALPTNRYSDLAASFPASETILNGRAPRKGNAAARLPAIKVLDNPAIAAAWRSFFASHTSDHFWADIVRVFGTALRRTHPDLERKAGKRLDAWRAGPRGAEGDLDVQLDCQFVINTPWLASDGAEAEPPSVKTPHVDKRDTIFSALLYFRDPADEGQGGDLELYSWTRRPRFLRHRMILPDDLRHRKDVCYAANTVVAFVNSAQAAHGVTPRAASQLPRRYINFIVETPFKAFDTPMMGPVGRLIHWHRRRGLGLRAIGGDRY
jgi:hypothetical protein